MRQKDKFFRGKGQSFLEYAVLIGITVAALIGMQAYIKRAMQGRLRSSAEQLTTNRFYSPGATVGDTITNTTTIEASDSVEKVTTSTATLAQTTQQKEMLLGYAEEPDRFSVKDEDEEKDGDKGEDEDKDEDAAEEQK